MARPRVRNRRAVSLMLRLPAAASAEYSPSECPATNAASRRTEKPASVSSTRRVAIDTAINAGRAVPDHGGELFAERGIDLIKHRAGGREGLRQRLAHADRLGALPRKSECCRHRRSLNVPEIPRVGPKDTAGAGCVKPPPVPSHRAPPPGRSLSLAIAVKILINRAIRGSRPGAERTVSAISPYRRY